MNINELKELAKTISDTGLVKEPTPVSIVGTTFGNEIQTKILTNIRISNMLLFYICTFETLRYFLVGN